MMQQAAVLYRHGQVPLHIVDYLNGGFQLRGKGPEEESIFIAFTPHDILECHIPEQPTMFGLCYQGDVWVTLQVGGRNIFDSNLQMDITSMVATVHRSGLRVVR